jgi:intracellular multiplication protein IcmV
MPASKLFKITRKTFVDPAGWMDLDSLKDSNKTIIQSIKNLFTVDRPLREETFEQAVDRLELTEEDIKHAYKSYRRYAIWFCVIGLLVFLYSFYLLFRYFTFAGWLIGIASSALFFTQAFKYDFWAFQIKNKKLGSTFEEWKRSVLGEPSK